MWTTVQAKASTLQQRQAEEAAVAREVEKMAVLYGGATPKQSGCLVGFFRSMFSVMRHRRRATSVATSEETAAVTNRMKSAGENALLSRLVGRRKDHIDETQRLDAARDVVDARVRGLRERVGLARERAMQANRAGRKEEAVRELRRSKATEKQLASARLALETLERQTDMLAEACLQKELTQVLGSSTASVKKKSKGLVERAEKAVDDVAEARDDVADISSAFEGLVPMADDDDDLVAELEEMMGESTLPAVAAAPVATAPMVAMDVPKAFPSVPKNESKRALLAVDNDL